MSSLPLRPSAHTVSTVPLAWLAAVEGMVFSRQLEPGTERTPVILAAVILGLMKDWPPSVDLPTAIEEPGFQVAITLPLGRTTGMENWPVSLPPQLTVT